MYSLFKLNNLQTKVAEAEFNVKVSSSSIETCRKNITDDENQLFAYKCDSGTGDEEKETSCSNWSKQLKSDQSTLEASLETEKERIITQTTLRKELADFEIGKKDAEDMKEKIVEDLLQIGADLGLTHLKKVKVLVDYAKKIETVTKLYEKIDKVQSLLEELKNKIPEYTEEIDLAINALTALKNIKEKAIEILEIGKENLAKEIIVLVEKLIPLIKKFVDYINNKIDSI